VERLFDASPGDGGNLLTMQVVATQEQRPTVIGPDSDAEMQAVFEAMSTKSAAPGVCMAFTTRLPLSGDRDEWGVQFESDTDASPALRYVVTPDYPCDGHSAAKRSSAEAQDRPNGRSDRVEQSFAKRKVSDRDPIGQRLRIGPENLLPTARGTSSWVS
jgi:hypothetical protein